MESRIGSAPLQISFLKALLYKETGNKCTVYYAENGTRRLQVFPNTPWGAKSPLVEPLT